MFFVFFADEGAGAAPRVPERLALRAGREQRSGQAGH